MAGHVCGGGMCGGACVAGQCAWQGACMASGMNGRGHAWQGCVAGEACMAGGHGWQGGMCGSGGMHGRYYEIWSMSGQYASYWNAFLFYGLLTVFGLMLTKAAPALMTKTLP